MRQLAIIHKGFILWHGIRGLALSIDRRKANIPGPKEYAINNDKYMNATSALLSSQLTLKHGHHSLAGCSD